MYLFISVGETQEYEGILTIKTKNTTLRYKNAVVSSMAHLLHFLVRQNKYKIVVVFVNNLIWNPRGETTFSEFPLLKVCIWHLHTKVSCSGMCFEHGHISVTFCDVWSSEILEYSLVSLACLWLCHSLNIDVSILQPSLSEQYWGSTDICFLGLIPISIPWPNGWGWPLTFGRLIIYCIHKGNYNDLQNRNSRKCAGFTPPGNEWHQQWHWLS